MFTGDLGWTTRKEAADLCNQKGADTEDHVTKNTTILVIGDLKEGQTKIPNKSKKMEVAEERIKKGQELQIWLSYDFKAFLDNL